MIISVAQIYGDSQKLINIYLDFSECRITLVESAIYHA